MLKGQRSKRAHAHKMLIFIFLENVVTIAERTVAHHPLDEIFPSCKETLSLKEGLEYIHRYTSSRLELCKLAYQKLHNHDIIFENFPRY